MAHRRKNDLIDGESLFPRIGFVDTGDRGSHVKDLNYRTALGTGIPAVAAAYIIGCDPPLFVGISVSMYWRLPSMRE